MTRNSSITPECSYTTLPTRTDECAKSKNCSEPSAGLLPPYLNNTEPLEPEDQGLQLALVTMEVASMRHKLAAMSRLLRELAMVTQPDLLMGTFGDG